MPRIVSAFGRERACRGRPDASGDFLKLRRRRGDRIRDGLRRASLAVAAAHLVAAGSIVLADELRKRRSTQRAGYPWVVSPEVCIDDDAAGDCAKLYSTGSELFDDMEAAILSATEEICIETFIWKGDATGRRIRDALLTKAREGVRVRTVFDGFANLVVPREFRDFDRDLNLLEFRPLRWSLSTLSPRTYFRDHRKLLVVDRSTAFIGGFNIGSPYENGTWRDTHLRLRGPSVVELRNAFVDFWNAHRPTHLPPMLDDDVRSWDSRIMVHRNDPQMRIFPIRGAYLEAIDRARYRAWITQAYFIPDRAFRRALIEAAQRNVDVRVLVPWNSNHVLADWLGRRHYQELLDAGVRLFAYQDLMLHSKTATVDGVWSTIGTANIDRMSLWGNYEINVELRDENVAAQLERAFEVDLRNSREIDAHRWRRRSPLHKLAELTLTGFSPFV